jgi:quinol monooxygenase YgiN
LKSFRIVNWLEAPNHSFILDVWSSLEAFEQHLAQPHSVDFRFAVQDQPPPDGICCIGSPIDDRQYSLVQSFGTPWTGNGLPSAVGADSALFVITYVDFLQALLDQGDPFRGEESLVKYGADSIKANPQHLLNFTVLRQLARPNRFVILEVWDTQSDYSVWQTSSTTADFVAAATPLLGSPLDYRQNILCGNTYTDNIGCVAP